MDLAKFASLILKGRIWFPSAASLINDDPFETMLPKQHFIDAANATIAMVKLNNPSYKGGDNLSQQLEMGYVNFRKNTYINCWHRSSVESMAMWKIYASDSAGIAIVSSKGRIFNSLKDSERSIFIGNVEYIDHDTKSINMGNLFNATLQKRLSYAYEQEVRLVTTQKQWDNPNPPAGLSVPCDLNLLIDRIVISPAAPIWFCETVDALCHLAKIEAPTIKSQLLSV